MYRVEKGSGWDIRRGEETILEVTSPDYAGFLCELMNKGATITDIENREHPDLEYADWIQEKYPPFDDDD